ncbi:MAG: PKD domain-containing protein [Lewinellaceae bacterium]|nr:PKD domain-containing protein [Lewinellaceae bacterium]
MHTRLLALVALLCFSLPASAQKYLEMMEAGIYPLSEIQQEAEAHFNIVGRERGSGYKQYKRWEYVAQMELNDAGVKIANVELAQRARDYRRAERQRQAESGGFAGDWKELGPTYWNATSAWSPGVGRVTSIGIDANNNNHLIIGSPTGGVWKTLNGAATWTNLTDDYSTVDVYALEISPYNSNHYLWGSTSGRIFRSTDGGTIWTTTGNVTGSGRVSRIQFHPTDPNTVYAVSESNGLFRSTNSGATWSAVSGANGTSGYDVEFKPGDPNTIYFSGRNVYRSINGGTSFSQISGFGTASNNYKMMGVSPANPDIVYVLESNGGRFGAFYKSTDSGASFTKLIDGADINYFGYSATGDDDRGQAPRDMDVAVRPSNAEEVHIAGIHTWKSTNGGTSFSLTSHWVPGTAASLGVGYNHADVDILKFKGDTLYVGTDGGIYRSTNGAQSFVDRTPGLGIREFYKIGVSKTNPNVVSGGSQDNGTGVMRGANRTWVDWLGADGMETFVDWNNANILYGTSQNGSMYRSSNQGNSYSSISKPSGVDDGAWITPFEQDPKVATTIYVAFADVWKSTNSGGAWTKISTFDNGNMNHLKLAPSDNQRIYAARGSSLFTTDNGGGAWTTITSAWGTNSISFIAVHPQNPERLLIVTSSAVYHSTNAGSTWTNISSGLPTGTKYCAAWENKGKNGIYVGGFGFVSYTNDDLGGQWVGFFEGLPNARVYELEINYVSNTIFAGTYGRGLWESPLYQTSPPVAAFDADKRQGCREMTVAFVDKSANNPTAWEWTFSGGTPATSTLQNPTVTFSGSGAYTVRLTASNDAGVDTAETADYIVIHGPSAPVVSGTERCGPGEVSFQATGNPGDAIRWFDSEAATDPLFTGDVFTTDITQTTTFYAAAGTNFISTQRVGPTTNTIGAGADHVGNQFLIFDAAKPFRLKSALVYAAGAKNRTFQVRNAAGAVLLEKIVFVNDGESRVTLDLDIPQGADLQIGCITQANLYRNNAGVGYPYSISGVVNIKNSTAGLDYYYYLYDIEVERDEVCESDRVAVVGTVKPLAVAATVSASGSTALCPGESVVLTAENVCPDCTVLWSNGETGPSITVSADGLFSATVGNACGDSPVSNEIAVAVGAAPTAATVAASGATALCPGESVVLTAENVCPDCTVLWSNGETGSSITVSADGLFSATVGNTCGDSPLSNEIAVAVGAAPTAATVAASGATALCPGESVVLTAENVCPGCTVLWSNGETGTSITVSADGLFSATVGNTCGDSPVSNEIAVAVGAAPTAATVAASGSTALCPGESVVLTAENVCPGCTVLWSNGETGPSITVAADGLFSATVGNTCGDSPVSNEIAVAVGAAPTAATVAASGSTALCPGESVVLTAENVCPDCTVLWSNGETGTSITVAADGLFSATVGNACGDSPVSNEIAVAVGAAPTAATVAASGSTALCPGESVVLTAENVCPGCTVLWSNGETGTSITVAADGLFSATVGNACGDSPVSNEIAVAVGAAPTAATVAASGSTALCPGESVVLTAENVCPDCTVLWSNGETGTSITVAADGLFSATVGNACGDSPVSNEIAVAVGSAPTAATVAASGSTALCPGESVMLTAENVCPDCTVLWSNGETGTSITVAADGLFSATVGNACGDSPVSNEIAVAVGAAPVAATVSASGSTALCPGESVVLTAENVCPGCTVLWSNGETVPSITVAADGVFSATVGNTCGDSPVSNAVSVTVNPPFVPAVQVTNLCELAAPLGSNYQWSVDGTFIPGANGQFWSALVAGQYVVSMNSPAGCPGVSEPVFAEACFSSAADLAGVLSARVYPNPAQDQIFLDIQAVRVLSVRLDLFAADGLYAGRLYQGDILPGGQILEIALPELPAGMYRYRLATESGIVHGNLVVLRR